MDRLTAPSSDSGAQAASASKPAYSSTLPENGGGGSFGRMKANTKYITTNLGLLNLVLIILLFVSWISIACVPRTKYLSIIKRTSVEEAYLFFGITGFLLEISIFLVHLLDLQTTPTFSSIPMNLVFLAKDLFYAIPIFALAITSAVYEHRERTSDILVYIFYNEGAFAAASFFGFVTVLCYATHFVLVLKDFSTQKSTTDVSVRISNV